MKIVRSIEDITKDCWCRLTEENFKAIKKLGIKMSHTDIFEKYSKNPNFEETDIFYICTDKMFANWASGDLVSGFPEIKFKLDEDKSDIKVETKKNLKIL